MLHLKSSSPLPVIIIIKLYDICILKLYLLWPIKKPTITQRSSIKTEQFIDVQKNFPFPHFIILVCADREGCKGMLHTISSHTSLCRCCYIFHAKITHKKLLSRSHVCNFLSISRSFSRPEVCWSLRARSQSHDVKSSTFGWDYRYMRACIQAFLLFISFSPLCCFPILKTFVLTLCVYIRKLNFIFFLLGALCFAMLYI
jgi:hypothetical protein